MPLRFYDDTVSLSADILKGFNDQGRAIPAALIVDCVSVKIKSDPLLVMEKSAYFKKNIIQPIEETRDTFLASFGYDYEKFILLSGRFATGQARC